jgi:F-type H+-transporting ATPase subunit gamma
VTNTRKITRAMEMVAAAKLKKYQDLLGQTQMYANELAGLLGNFIAAAEEGGIVGAENVSLDHPYFQERPEQRSLIILIASDSGLCGSYNSNLFHAAELFLRRSKAAQTFLAVGRQASAYLRRTGRVVSQLISVPKPQDMEQAVRAAMKNSTEAFRNESVDRVYIIYTAYQSMASYKPAAEQLLPLQSALLRTGGTFSSRWILEPSPEQLLRELIPHYLEVKMEQCFKQALVSEQVSRMIAMRQATDNASEMIDSLTLQRNKARQAAITKELLEIVSGSRALQVK